MTQSNTVKNSATATRYLHTDKIRKHIEEGNNMRALVQISSDLEQLFFFQLYFKKDISPNLIERWTLGSFFRWVAELNLIDKKDIPLISKFNKTRNMIIHGRYELDRIEKDKKRLGGLKKLLLSLCDFIDATGVKSEYRQEKEVKLAEHYDKIIKKRMKSDEFI